MKVSGFTIVANAVRLDFPVVESIRSILDCCEEVVVNVGRSDDGTLDLVRSLRDPRIRVLETRWDMSRGPAVLAEETARAMGACRHRWGIYIQADEVLHEHGVPSLLDAIGRADRDPSIEGVVVRYRHIFGRGDLEATNRHWYRREVRAVRLDPSAMVHPFRDAQGFRVGPSDRRVRALLADAEMFHYGYLRSAAAMRNRIAVDRTLYPERGAPEGDPAYLWWAPGLRPFRGSHPAVALEWVAARSLDPERRISPPRPRLRHLRYYCSDWIERLTGWRPFEFRNYELR
ncbi:MAG: hypothetical protein FJ206_06585 [Gemmatimonadetes bacterium]|nr:hypothetical protein [Gemmatimonadota bacterium]